MSTQSSRRWQRWSAFLLALILLATLTAGCFHSSEPDDTLPPETSAQETTLPEIEIPQTQPDTTEASVPQETEPETEPEPEPLTLVSTATLSAAGDLLMHIPVINSGLKSDGSYDFTGIFRYLSPYVTAADYAAVNLETTLCGTGNGYAYSGYPRFNCPDGIVDSAAAAGFDMLLTANNHCNDTGTKGFTRTLQVIEDRGLASLGTQATAEEPDYRVVELNGISIGLICYTYSTTQESGVPSVNGLPLASSIAEQINVFDYDRLDAFYTDLEGQLAAMEAEGAEAVVLFIHWGQEYQLKANSWQRSIAQSLCDLGVDVIIGNHPHVVQSAELLTSTLDPSQKTVCLYSTGNAVSNQRQGSIDSLSTAHTEDGVLFSVTFAKYSDGSVVLDDVDALPFWLQRQGSGGSRKYTILPLDAETMEDWKTLYELSDSALEAATNSYWRTMAQLGEGLEDCLRYPEEIRPETSSPDSTIPTE